MAKIVKTGVVWMLFLGAALLILSGRYSWDASSLTYSRRGFLDSAYMLVFTLPTAYYLLRKFVGVRFVPEALVLILAIILVLPYHWLGLEKYQYSPFYSYPWQGVDASKFPAFAQDFPAGIRQLGQLVPFLYPFLAFLIILGLISAIFCTYYKTESLFKNHRIELVFWLGLFVLVILQTWIHLSYHSPILASTLMNRTPLSGWYAVPLFPNNQGIMMADYQWWRDLEAYFMGLPFNPEAEFIRRSYLFYLTSQFSYFISPYYVYVTRNILLWFGASGAMFLLAKRITSQTGSAIFTALLTGVGSGFILYSTEAPDNLAGYAVIPILLLIFIKFIDAERQTLGDYILFGCFLGLASLVYDIFPWYLALPGIAWIMKKPVAKVILCLGISGSVYGGFLLLQARVLGINLASRNADFITSSLVNIFGYVIHFHIKLLYTLTLRGFDLYFYTLAAAFLVLPLFLAGAGLALIRERRIFLLLFAFWLIPFLTFVALLYGNQNWLEAPLVALPRLHYTNFLWVYIAAGFCLNSIREKLKARKLEFLAYAIPIVILLIIFLLNNADVFGWHQLYAVID